MSRKAWSNLRGSTAVGHVELLEETPMKGRTHTHKQSLGLIVTEAYTGADAYDPEASPTTDGQARIEPLKS